MRFFLLAMVIMVVTAGKRGGGKGNKDDDDTRPDRDGGRGVKNFTGDGDQSRKNRTRLFDDCTGDDCPERPLRRNGTNCTDGNCTERPAFFENGTNCTNGTDFNRTRQNDGQRRPRGGRKLEEDTEEIEVPELDFSDPDVREMLTEMYHKMMKHHMNRQNHHSRGDHRGQNHRDEGSDRFLDKPSDEEKRDWSLKDLVLQGN